MKSCRTENGYTFCTCQCCLETPLSKNIEVPQPRTHRPDLCCCCKGYFVCSRCKKAKQRNKKKVISGII
jgi:hypothetical protein